MAKNDVSPSIQTKLAQLDELVSWFDGDDFELEKAAAKLAEAKKLADAIENDLSNVENDITIIKQSFVSDEA